MAVNGKAKGDAFENLVCRLMTLWYAPQVDVDGNPVEDGHWESCSVYDLPFRRQTTSIMPGTGHWNGEGDVMHAPSIKDMPFCVEAKKVEGWTLDQMGNDGWKIWAYWDQAKKQAQRLLTVTKKSVWPLLIFSRNRCIIYAMSYAHAPALKSVVSREFPVLDVRVAWEPKPLRLCSFYDLRTVEAPTR